MELDFQHLLEKYHPSVSDLKVDLHSHSFYSDGTDAPAEIVRKAKSRGLDLVALTDHDTIEGGDEFSSEGEKIGIRTLLGIEFDISPFKEIKPIHLLGYFLNRTNHTQQELERYSIRRAEARNRRLDLVIEILSSEGIIINREEVLQEAKGKISNKLHIAKVILRNYSHRFSSIGEVMDQYLTEGTPFYVPTEGRFNLSEAIRSIHTLNGLAILAHPGVSNGRIKDNSRALRLIEEAFRLGADGVEGFYLYYKNTPYRNCDLDTNEALCLQYIEQTLKKDKIVTAGSDYHGQNKTIELGESGGKLLNFPPLI